MSRDDLLADLQGEVLARSAAPASAVPMPAPSLRGRPATPTFDLAVTPLQWSLPSVVAPSDGIGLGVRFGPVRVSLALR